MGIYRKDVIALAGALNTAKADANLSDEQALTIAKIVGAVLADRSPSYDRTMFFAYALSPVLEPALEG